ncbi:hypothetical protein D4R99_00985 [bacterium]|nr:MAG: hypothetical protein D4R99_00985 [bacterium]
MKKKTFIVLTTFTAVFTIGLTSYILNGNSSSQNTAYVAETCLKLQVMYWDPLHEVGTGHFCCQWDEDYEQWFVVGEETTCAYGGTSCAIMFCDTGSTEPQCQEHLENNCDPPPAN